VLLAAFDGPIPEDCRAALDRLERHSPAIASGGFPTVRRASGAVS
jgi:hypothetical protein